MEDKIQRLAEKIYKDGVVKANDEAEQILNNAKSSRDGIISQAQAQAEQILLEAKKEASRMKERAEAEIITSVTNAREALKGEITNLLTQQSVSKGVQQAMHDPAVLQNVVFKMAEKMIEEGGNGVIISTSEAEDLKSYFQAHAADILNKGVEIKQVSGLSHSFDIAPKEGGYKMNISQNAFEEYFKDFLRPRMRDLLFANATGDQQSH